MYDLKNWDFTDGDDYDFTPILFQPTDQKMYKFMSQIMWDEVKVNAMFHLPYRFHHMFNDLDVFSEWAIMERLLMLAGDVETNPGPVQSRPLYIRNNDPRCIRLEKALDRRDQKIKTLIKHLRQQIKNNKITPQGLFDTLRESNGQAGELNGNLTRICNFLEDSLPTIQSNIQATLSNYIDRTDAIKNDLVKLTLLLLIVRLMMVWKKYRMALVS